MAARDKISASISLRSQLDKMNRIKVYKTDVDNRSAAESILDDIRRLLHNYDVSFDLEDCDKVLRIENLNGRVNESKIINILHNYGYQIERLP